MNTATHDSLSNCPIKWKGLVFDCDGVLVDTEPLHVDAWMALFERYGIDVSREGFDRFFGVTSPQTMRILAEEGRLPDDLDHREFIDARRDWYIDRLHQGIEEVPGAQALLDASKGRVGLAIATSNLPETINLIVDIMGWGETFDTVVDLGAVREAKPAPDIYEVAAQRLGLDPAECLAFEDSVPGIEAASSAGMCVVGVATNHPASLLLEAGAWKTINNYLDTEVLLAALRG